MGPGIPVMLVVYAKAVPLVAVTTLRPRHAQLGMAVGNVVPRTEVTFTVRATMRASRIADATWSSVTLGTVV